MTAIEISSKKNWSTTKQSLQAAFKQEIHLMREILANLHQEELSLLENAPSQWEKIMSDRSDLTLQLKSLRSKRMEITTALTKHAVILGKKELLPPNEASSCEILSQLDQLIALLERINLQNCRNDALFEQTKQKEELPLYCSYPHPVHVKRRKTFVATYAPKR